ncbi:Uncharacterised protein [uncultured archaeon]|nr:Uncharacterised protein [uncultured archaeon]
MKSIKLRKRSQERHKNPNQKGKGYNPFEIIKLIGKGEKMKAYEVKGYYTKSGKHTFTIKVNAESEKLVREKVFAEFGGKQGITRRHIIVESVKAA